MAKKRVTERFDHVYKRSRQPYITNMAVLDETVVKNSFRNYSFLPQSYGVVAIIEIKSAVNLNFVFVVLLFESQWNFRKTKTWLVIEKSLAKQKLFTFSPQVSMNPDWPAIKRRPAPPIDDFHLTNTPTHQSSRHPFNVNDESQSNEGADRCYPIKQKLEEHLNERVVRRLLFAPGEQLQFAKVGFCRRRSAGCRSQKVDQLAADSRRYTVGWTFVGDETCRVIFPTTFCKLYQICLYYNFYFYRYWYQIRTFEEVKENEFIKILKESFKYTYLLKYKLYVAGIKTNSFNVFLTFELTLPYKVTDMQKKLIFPKPNPNHIITNITDVQDC